MIRYLIKKRESIDTVKLGTGTRHFMSAQLANYHLDELIKWDRKYKKYDVYFTSI